MEKSLIKTKTQNNGISVMLIIICVVSNLSQFPLLLSNKFMKLIVTVSWLIPFFYLAVTNLSSLRFKNAAPLAFLVWFDLFMLFGELFTNNSYFSSNLVYPLHLCVFMFYVTYFLGQLEKRDIVGVVSKPFCVSVFIVAVAVYFLYYFGHQDTLEINSFYRAKNSLATIVLFAVAIAALYSSSVNKLIKYGFVSFFIFFIFILRSRASIVSGICFLMFFVFFSVKSKKVKWTAAILSCAFVLLVFTNKTVYNVIINQIFLMNRQADGLDAISSGRIDHFYRFAEIYKSHPFIGIGATHIESFPLFSLANFGIFGSVPVFLLSLYPFYVFIKYRKEAEYKTLRSFIGASIVILYSNSIFEALPPFGPGVKCYLLWFATGFFMGRISQRETGAENKRSTGGSKYIL